MNNDDEIPPPETTPNALDILTEIALLKESGKPADLRQAGNLFAGLLTENQGYLRRLASVFLPFDGSNYRLDIDDLYSHLVTKIWEKADQFNPKETTPSAIKKQFIGWAVRILRNRVNDILASLQHDVIGTDSIEELGWDAFAEENPEPSQRARILAEILDEMDPNEAELLRWWAMATPLDGTQLRTNSEERNAICRKLNVTPASLRKRKERAFEALREEIEARLTSAT
jgi:RNA polymerase sigma factor (sigma-70 family)